PQDDDDKIEELAKEYMEHGKKAQRVIYGVEASASLHRRDVE
ncbi:hypothetical protein Tco_1358349, partial [Tanacetum coccineum]